MRSTSCSWRGVTERSRLFSFAAAAVCWTLVCLRWFDAAAPLRPRALEAVPAAVLRRAAGRRPRGLRAGRAVRTRARRRLRAMSGCGWWSPWPSCSVCPWRGRARPATSRADGALSGLVALDARDGPCARRVRPSRAVQRQPEGDPHRAPRRRDRSRARLRARLRAVLRGVRGRRLPPRRGDGARAGQPSSRGLAAGLYAAFSPAFVTRYSLSNDGNYVEVLALGTWALVLALRWAARAGAPASAASPSAFSSVSPSGATSSP